LLPVPRFTAPVVPESIVKAFAPVELNVPAPAKVRAVAEVAIVSIEATPVSAPAVVAFNPPFETKANVPVALPIVVFDVPVPFILAVPPVTVRPRLPVSNPAEVIVPVPVVEILFEVEIVFAVAIEPKPEAIEPEVRAPTPVNDELTTFEARVVPEISAAAFTVIEAFGNVIVLVVVGSVITKVVLFASGVNPSNTSGEAPSIFADVNVTFPVALSDVNAPVPGVVAPMFVPLIPVAVVLKFEDVIVNAFAPVLIDEADNPESVSAPDVAVKFNAPVVCVRPLEAVRVCVEVNDPLFVVVIPVLPIDTDVAFVVPRLSAAAESRVKAPDDVDHVDAAPPVRVRAPPAEEIVPPPFVRLISP